MFAWLKAKDSTAAIRLWAQELVNLRIQELINEDEETMDIEEARAMVHETISKEYALPWTNLSSNMLMPVMLRIWNSYDY